MNYVITLTCEYIFAELECIIYLSSINVDPKQYEYIYCTHDMKYKKKTRRLNDVTKCDLSEYPNLLHITFHDNFNEHITTWSKNITHIIFGHHYNKELKLHNNVIHLTLRDHFDKQLYLPNRLASIVLGHKMNQSISRLPKHLLYLTLGNLFKCELPALPNSLINLVLGSQYNRKILKLPTNLLVLKLGYDYQHKLPKLPYKLRHLTVDRCYDHKIILPNTLIQLEWYNYNKLPKLSPHLTHLTLIHYQKIMVKLSRLRYLAIYGYDYDYEFIDLPDELEQLIIQFDKPHKHNLVSKRFKRQINTLPSQLKILKWDSNWKLQKLPDKLKHLSFSAHNPRIYPDMFRSGYCHQLFELPKELTHLDTGHHYCSELPRLPFTLTHLTLGYHFKVKPPIMPFSLEYLEVKSEFGTEKYILPNNLKILSWHSNNKLPTLPRELQCLKLYPYMDTKWDKPVPTLPDSIKRIEFISNWKRAYEFQKVYGNKVVILN
jgi:hypothetical protein